MDKAVALKYINELPAPFVVAKGRGELAKVIEKIAKESKINVINNGLVADRLVELDVGQFIPEDLFEIIAEILVFICNIKVA
ncbi:MAG: EscU/YscU/HrcU family type III secretion system export apparatus switch protein [Spirochaetales bacterium]|nr:EscU/YscU/HrcU family type III secretion system export apparatus switch protein [Spirochaetales bacterium]